jgi:hypothetical protein
VLSAPDLSPAAKVVYGVLSRFQGANGASWPKLSTIAAHAGLSLSGTKKAIKELKSKGYLTHSYGDRNVFVLQIPIRTLEAFCQRIGHPELAEQVRTGSQGPSPRTRKAETKAYPEAGNKASVAAIDDLDSLTMSDELRRKYANWHVEDAIWNGFLAAHSQTNSDQDGKNGAGTQIGTGEYPLGYHQGTQIGTEDKASAQTRSATAEPEDMYLREVSEDSLEDKGEEKNENSLKSLAPNEEKSKSEQNFQLGGEEKVGLEPKSLSAEPEVSEETSKNKPPVSSNGPSPSARHPAPSSPNEDLVFDPETGRCQNYANLPAWARHMVAGLLNLRRERDNLLNLLPGARGAEMVMLRARIQELEQEIDYNETRLRELLSQEAGQTADAREAPVAVGGEARG